ncbi:lysosome membrane protein 2-like isoform X4 [Portunus trituberculatus]|uniref:lysosome membrane protein 2-like isoform X4 n=1 Tax=Portunus trituberculatus TaxID=210409 RepID=UPI001E1CB0BB|nr:lysosome membrane protein 2-like isoform X4 [Portunus trituberculatus]
MLPITQVKVMTGVGATLVLLCSIFIGVFPVIFNSIVDKMLVVREDSDTFEAFVTPPIPIYMQFWLFNVTNPEEIRYNGAKPVLEEVGPYTYEEVRVKYAFNWTTEGSVSYLQNKSYVFSQEMSGDLREDDLITSINVLMVVNNTNDKVYTVKTGADGMDDFMNIQFWNGSSSLHYWQGNGSEYCNMINGTDGSQYPPRLTRSSVLRIYTSELCRSLYLTYEKDLYHHGIPVYRYIPPREVLEDPEINHDNLCYCYPDRDSCLGAGMLNLQPCLGLPLVLSTPHFYQGDEVELAKLVGLNPTKEEHETTIDVEPRTGVAMYAAKKMQLNIPLKRYGNLPSFKNVPEVIFPILWVNESAEVDSKMAREVRNAVYIPFVVVDALCGSLIAIGALLLVVSGFRYLHIKPKYSFTALHSSTAPDNCCVKIEKPVDKIGRAADLEKL